MTSSPEDQLAIRCERDEWWEALSGATRNSNLLLFHQMFTPYVLLPPIVA